MKNALKLIGIIAIAAVIGFCLVSCGDDGAGGNSGGNNSGNTGGNGGGNGGGNAGNNITSGAEVVYDSSIKDLTEAKGKTDFGYTYYYDEEENNEEIKPLSEFLDGSPSVKISGGKVTINFGTPKSDYLSTFNNWLTEYGLTVSPSNAKFFVFNNLVTADGKYFLGCIKDDNNLSILFYADKDATISGTASDIDGGKVWTSTFNVSLKKGWNYLIMSDNEETSTATYTSSVTQPSGFKWTVWTVLDDRRN